MPRRTKEEAEQTRRKLIHTALMLFSEKGVAKTTLNDISKAAGVTKGAFYWHFKDKREIFEAIHEAYAMALDETVHEMMSKADEPVQGLLDGVGYYCAEVQRFTGTQKPCSWCLFTSVNTPKNLPR